MQIDGSAPVKGTQGDRTAASKPASKGDGKSFAAAFKKASTAHPLVPTTPPVPPAPASATTAANQPAPVPEAKCDPAPENALQNSAAKEGPVKNAAISAEDHMETIKFRLKSGYYNTKNVDEALTDKLTGFFDELA